MSDNTLEIVVKLTEPRANALAQLVKRFGYEDACRLSNAFDGGQERDNMIDAIIDLSAALHERGFAPR